MGKKSKFGQGLHLIPLYHHHMIAGPWNTSAATATWELWLLVNYHGLLYRQFCAGQILLGCLHFTSHASIQSIKFRRGKNLPPKAVHSCILTMHQLENVQCYIDCCYPLTSAGLTLLKPHVPRQRNIWACFTASFTTPPTHKLWQNSISSFLKPYLACVPTMLLQTENSSIIGSCLQYPNLPLWLI